MKIEFTKTNEALTVALDGRLDTTTAPELQAFLCEHCADADALILDCEKLVYISSAGLRVLLSAQKKYGKLGYLKVINVCEEILSVFEMTGFADILTIE